jgi:hypothetical protein
VPTVQRWEKKEHLPVHRHAHEAQASVYAYRSELDRWWRERDAGLRPTGAQGIRRLLSPVVEASGLLRGRIRRRAWVAGIAIVVALAALVRWGLLAANRRWAHGALPQIERLASADAPYFWSGDDSAYRAYRLAIAAQRYIPDDAELTELWNTISRTIEITTEPAGADISISSYSGSEPVNLGRSPLSSVRIPLGFLRWRLEKEGYEAAEGLMSQEVDSLHVVLDSVGSSPPGMVRAPGGTFELGLTHLGSQPTFELGDYWIDRYEVTNREFKRFVDAGGYSDLKY